MAHSSVVIATYTFIYYLLNVCEYFCHTVLL